MPIPRPESLVPSGNWIHARFNVELKEGALEWIKKFPRYIVAEEVGSVTEKLHYHVAFESHIGLEAIKKRFQTQCKALGLVSKKGQESAYYGGVKELTDIYYVCKEGKYIAHQGFTDEELESYRLAGSIRYPPKMQSVPIIVHMGQEPDHGPKFKTTKTSMRAKFKDYLEQQGYDCQTITIENISAERDKLIDHLTEFWENAFTTPQGAVCVEFAQWSFATEEARDFIKDRNREAIKKCLR